MKENDILSSTTADTRSAENIIFNIMVHRAGKKNEQATINKEYESIEANIDSIVKLIQSPLACTQICGDKYTYKSRSGNKSIMKEIGNAYRNANVRPSSTTTWWGKISHKFKQAVNYVAPIALTAVGVGATAVGGLATVMTGGAIIPLSLATAGLLGTTGSVLFRQGTTKHNGVSDANYYTQKVNEIMENDTKNKDVDKLKENVVILTKALVKLQSGLVSLKDEEVMKYCQKLKELVVDIKKKEEEQKIKNNDEKKSNVNISQQKSLYNNNTENINNDVINKHNLTVKDKTQIDKNNQ